MLEKSELSDMNCAPLSVIGDGVWDAKLENCPNRLFRLFHFFTETESWTEQTEDHQFDRAHISVFFRKFRVCKALPKAEFFIEPPPDTQRRRRRGERGIGVARGSYLLLTSLSPPPSSPPPHRAPAALPGAALSGLAVERPPPSPLLLMAKN